MQTTSIHGGKPMMKIGLGRTGAVAVVLASAAVALSGCGSSASRNTAASSAEGSGGTPAPGQTASSTKAAQFSQCMRAHGVPDFPDPNANGSFDLKVTKGSDLDPSSSAFQSADQACKSLQPAGFGSGSTQSVANQNKTLQFVSCMRSHGVPKFPEPQPTGALLLTSSSGVDPNSPTFQSAMQTCHKLLPGGGTGASVGG
jgi:hypothetical protein